MGPHGGGRIYQGWVADTEFEWCEYLRSREGLEEVNFWRPSRELLAWHNSCKFLG